MALEELVDRLGTGTTRRTVVKTGAKLAYAAPLVAATMKLTSGGAGAVSANGPCETFICGNGPCVITGQAFDCFCFENTATPGHGTCLGDFFCASATPCPNGQSNCASGETCVTNTCCGQGVQLCAPACGANSDANADGTGPTAGGR